MPSTPGVLGPAGQQEIRLQSYLSWTSLLPCENGGSRDLLWTADKSFYSLIDEEYGLRQHNCRNFLVAEGSGQESLGRRPEKDSPQNDIDRQSSGSVALSLSLSVPQCLNAGAMYRHSTRPMLGRSRYFNQMFPSRHIAASSGRGLWRCMYCTYAVHPAR